MPMIIGIGTSSQCINALKLIIDKKINMSATPKSSAAAVKADDESKISKAPLQEEVEDSIDKVEVLPS